MKTLTRRDELPTRQSKLANLALDDSISSESPVSVPHRLALVDSGGNIVAVNQDWRSLAQKTGTALNRTGPGANYLDVCRKASTLSADARIAWRGIEAVLIQKVSSFEMDYRCQTPAGPACFHMEVIPVAYMGAFAAITHREVTGMQQSNDKNVKLLEQFALRLINAQEDERKRISQEMHDDLGNRIALMALTIRHIIKENSGNSNSTGSELQNLFEQIMDFSSAVRELSHGLHPLLLRHVGINAALKSLQEKFEKTHRIRLNLLVAAELPRLSDEVALCIFRIAQESLQNVVKHSGARTVTVVLAHAQGRIRLTISDTGRGFVRSEAAHRDGLGLPSMEARALAVGGRFNISSSPGEGTEVCLTIPIQEGLSKTKVQ